MGKIRNQWEQIRGNAKYEAARSVLIWFYTKLGVSMVATLTAAVTFISGHREMAMLVGIPAVFWVLQIFLAWAAPKKLHLRLTPHGENSSDVYLEVTNGSNSTRMSAQIKVLRRSYGDGVKKYCYTGIWSGPKYAKEGWNHVQPVRDHGEKTSVAIDTGKSHLLRIATILDKEHGLCTLALVGIEEEKLMWDFEPTPNSHLPFFVLNIKLFGEGFPNTISRDYKVGPKTFRGAMEMTEVVA